MAPPKSKNQAGLGRAIINKKVRDAREARESNNYTTEVDSTTKLQSVTQERDLDEFLNTAQLAGTEFTAEKQNIKVIQLPGVGASTAHNPFLLTAQEEKETLQKHQENKGRLRVPRRPPWTKDMTPTQLDRQERDAFLEWRRDLAQLQEAENFLLTPFERNLEVWRQLWRVIERSHLVVQIVDARNPLRFRCEDLEKYVYDVEGAEGEKGTGKGKRKSLLLINKADLLTVRQRQLWADYFDSQNVRYAFFSAANATALQQARGEGSPHHESTSLEPQSEVIGEKVTEITNKIGEVDIAGPERNLPLEERKDISDDTTADHDEWEDEDDGLHAYGVDDHDDNPRTKVLTVLELEELFVKSAPPLSSFADQTGITPPKLVVGLVGYPNVGKSSTINSLIGEKKVSVSSTPGKTKHFQTIHLSSSMVLCDCPGLVFPQFATTKAELVCDGVLPIDQMREYTGPTTLVVKRISREVLEGLYGLTIRRRAEEEGGDGQVTAEDLLVAYAVARGFARSGQGNPDESRAARYILKDYVNARLLFCHPPPGISESEFNQETRNIALERLRALRKKRAPTTRVSKGADTFISVEQSQGSGPAPQSKKSQAVDNSFFESGSVASRPFVQGSTRAGQQYSRAQLYPHQNMIADDGTPLSGPRTRNATSGESGKRHFKPKRTKQRSGKGYD